MTPTTNAVAKTIGRLAGEYRAGERDALSFATAADAAMDQLRELERAGLELLKACPESAEGDQRANAAAKMRTALGL